MVDLADARRAAESCAVDWKLELGAPFAMSNVSFVAPTREGSVVKSPWGGDDESLHEGDALELWDGDGAVRLLRRSGRVLLEERAIPGTDLSLLPEGEATAIAVDLASRLWKRPTGPFRPVAPEVRRWLDRAESEGSELVGLARQLLGGLGERSDWLVHGDFHHHNIVASERGYLAIDPKPYLGEREYDVPSFLWNPMMNRLRDGEMTNRRIAAFVALGLDEFRIRAWTVVRGAYLRTDAQYVAPLRALVA
jgi:streptomycin 6-kinase